MSSTNTTPNFGLPQYIPTDKPTYLGDFNKAMLDIDTNMKSIENKATSAESEIETVQATANQALENANTAQTTATTAQGTANQAKTNAEVAKTTADTALENAQTAQNTANEAKTTAGNVLSAFNLNNIQTYTPEAVSGCNLQGSDKVTIATNSDNSIAKIYCSLIFTNTAQSKKIKIKNTPFRPAEEFVINPIGFSSSESDVCRNVRAVISPDGTITFNMFGASSGTSTMILLPCIYFMKNFGDVN